MRSMPSLETGRLIIRPFAPDDLNGTFRLFDIEVWKTAAGPGDAAALEARRAWLQWSALNHQELAKLGQPPYGDRAIILKQSRELIGSVGYVPYLDVFGQLPYFRARGLAPDRASTELGLFWAIAPAHQRRGYATEAAGAMIKYAFEEMRLGRIIATTDYNNVASMGVMRKLDMHIQRNPQPEPPWLQVVGVLEAGAHGKE